MAGSRATFLLLVILVAFSVAACREEGDIQIASIKFTGVEQVDAGALANALQTKKGSWLPWGRKRYFDRRAFEADLKRIEAFYRDRGFPDARVRSFDVQAERRAGQGGRHARHLGGRADSSSPRSTCVGSTCFPRSSCETLRETLPLQPERPLDRQLEIASRERALNVLRDEGYPYAQVSLIEQELGPKRRTLTLDGDAGRAGALR